MGDFRWPLGPGYTKGAKVSEPTLSEIAKALMEQYTELVRSVGALEAEHDTLKEKLENSEAIRGTIRKDRDALQEKLRLTELARSGAEKTVRIHHQEVQDLEARITIATSIAMSRLSCGSQDVKGCCNAILYALKFNKEDEG